MVAMSEDYAAVFDKVFSVPIAGVEREVWRDVFGDEYPDGLDTFSYVSRTELVEFAGAIADVDAARVLDLGCGRGGCVLWMAEATGADAVGVDIAESAIATATDSARALGLDDRARFVVGSFESVPAPDDSFDAVMSIDAFLFAPDKRAAIREIARVLRPGGCLVFTSWDFRSQPSNRPPQVEDHRPLLAEADFEVLRYDETVDWVQRQRGTTTGLLASVSELAPAWGVTEAEARAALEEMDATMDHHLRRFIAVAHLHRSDTARR